jgi:hypothetical protein
MNTRKICLWAAPVLVVALAVAAYFFFFKSRPQIIELSDGTKLTLLGVTYGKHHVSPVPKGAPKSVRPQRMDTAEETLCVWMQEQRKGNNYPNYEVLAYDSANTACVGSWTRTYGNNRGGNNIAGVSFDAFPRRGKKVILRFTEWGRNGQEVAKGEFVVSNPARGKTFSSWSPESLPITQSDGDLDVTLTRLAIDRNNMFNSNGQDDKDAKTDPRNRAVLAAFRATQNGSPATNWQPVSVITSDATGNHTGMRSWSNRHENDEEVMTYQWGLWSDEPAWKLRVEFSRTSGFNSDELWTVSEIPFVKGDINNMWNNRNNTNVFAETTLNDIHLQLFKAIQPPAEQARNYGNLDAVLLIRAKPMPEGWRMKLAKVTDDRGHEVQAQDWGSGGGDYRFALRNFGGSTNINITLAFHRSRYVEFTAKPQMEASRKP